MSGTHLRVLPDPSRRRFLAGCAACAASALCPSVVPGFASPPDSPGKTTLRLVFTHISPEKQTWPYKGYDYDTRKQELTSKLQKACPNVQFLVATAQNAEDARKILVDDHEVDGYLVYMVGIWTGAAAVIASANRPTLFVDDLYGGSGEFLMAYAAAKRHGLRVAGVASSRFEDVVSCVKAFETIKALQSAVILDVVDRAPGSDASAIQDAFGATVRKVSAAELNQAYEKADRTESEKCAERWVKSAHRIVEPSREEISKSGRMYVAMRDLLRQHRSTAITIDCLTMFYGGLMPAYPCLGFFQLNNEGMVGACEADLQSTITMLAVTSLTGRPGYISDPVIDTSKNQIIYAHCVAPSKPYGPAGPSNPFDIRSHSEDRKGASIRSLLPLGEVVTTLKFDPARREAVFHQAKTVANIDDDKACRTKLAAEVKDVHKLFAEWDQWGWHRVTFYGDLREPVYTLSSLLGFKMIEEG
jgi:hypothetical protein